MNQNLSPASPRPLQHLVSSLSWAAVFGGLTAAMALQVLFMMLGAGLGFAIYRPITSENPIEDFSAGAVVIQGISAVFSLWFGGWIAGRFTPLVSRAAGALHGFLVWCAATVAGVVVVSVGAGWIVGDLTKMVGSGLSAAGKVVEATGTTELARDAARQTTETLNSFTDEAVAQLPADTSRANSIREKRDLQLAIARLFNPLQKDKQAENKTAVTQALVQAGLSQQDADRIVAGWTTTYERLTADLAAARQQAEDKARAAAQKAARTLTLFSLVAFFAFLLGGISAALGGQHGARCAFRHDDRGEVPA